MSKQDGVKEIKGDAGNIQHRYTLTQEEREKIQNLQSVLGILGLQREGLNHSIMLEIARIRKRCGIQENGPEGFQRVVDFDPQKYEMVVSDLKIVKKEEKPVKDEKLPN